MVVEAGKTTKKPPSEELKKTEKLLVEAGQTPKMLQSKELQKMETDQTTKKPNKMSNMKALQLVQ